MNITDIMQQEVIEERERSRWEILTPAEDCSFPWIPFLVLIAVIISMLAFAFSCGVYYQACREEQASRENQAWLERIEREATESARAMSNAEILATMKATK